MVSDPYGRILATMDHFSAGERVIVAQVPTQGVRTFYPLIGDLVGWLALAGVAAMVAIVLIRQRKASATGVGQTGNLAPA